MNKTLDIKVTEPTKCGDTLSSYISYKIITKAQRKEFERVETRVVRRYTDFVWLFEELCRIYPGCIIPTLPEKQTVGRFSPEFVESRRRALEKFLIRIGEHAILGYSSILARFLQSDDHQFNEIKDQSKANKAKITDKAFSWFQGTANNIAAATSKTKQLEPERTPTDHKIDELFTYITLLEKQIELIYKYSQSLVKKSTETASTLYDFSTGLLSYGQLEGNHYGKIVTQVGASIEKFSYESTQHAETELRELEEPLEEYIRYVISVKATLNRRQDKRTQFKANILDLDLKEQAYNKVIGVPGREKEAVQKQDAVEKAHMALQTIKIEYEKMNEQILHEFEIFQQQKANDICHILSKYATIQSEYHEKASLFYSTLIPMIPISGTLSTDWNTDHTPIDTNILTNKVNGNTGKPYYEGGGQESSFLSSSSSATATTTTIGTNPSVSLGRSIAATWNHTTANTIINSNSNNNNSSSSNSSTSPINKNQIDIQSNLPNITESSKANKKTHPSISTPSISANPFDGNTVTSTNPFSPANNATYGEV